MRRGDSHVLEVGLALVAVVLSGQSEHVLEAEVAQECVSLGCVVPEARAVLMEKPEPCQ